MVQKLSEKIVDKLVDNKILKEEDKEIYYYGYSILLMDMIDVALAILVGIVFRQVPAVVLFLIFYIPLRSYSGGYHATSTVNCTIVTVFVLIFICILNKVLPDDGLLPIMAVGSLAATVIAYLKVPVEAVHKPLKEMEKKVYRRKAFIWWMIAVLAAVLAYCCHKHHIGFTIDMTIVMTGIMLLIPQKREK